MSIIYEYGRYHATYTSQHSSLHEAIWAAFSDHESGEAWPQKITDGEMVLWEQSGPLTTGKTLLEFAKQSGVDLPNE